MNKQINKCQIPRRYAATQGASDARLQVEMYRDNMAMNDNVLAAAHQHGCKKVISMLSTCVFPDKTSYPIGVLIFNIGICYA